MITTLQAARLLNVKPTTIRKWIWQGKIKAVKVGRDNFISESDLHIPPQLKRGRKPKDKEQKK